MRHVLIYFYHCYSYWNPPYTTSTDLGSTMNVGWPLLRTTFNKVKATTPQLTSFFFLET